MGQLYPPLHEPAGGRNPQGGSSAAHASPDLLTRAHWLTPTLSHSLTPTLTSTLAHPRPLPQQKRVAPGAKEAVPCGGVQSRAVPHGARGGAKSDTRRFRFVTGAPVLTVAGTKRRKAAWDGRFATGNATPPARYRAEWQPPELGTVPIEKRPVVADCGDLSRKCRPALRAGCVASVYR